MSVSDETVRRLTEQNKIAEFAMSILKMDERRAEVFRKACADRFVWDGTLKFHGTHGDVPADDEQCTGFFQREYDFLVPAKEKEGEHGELDANDITLARAGNVTARGRLFRELHGDKPRTAEGETAAALDKLLAGETKVTVPGDKKITTHSGTNPWGSGPGEWNITKQGALIKALGEEKAAGIAKAAGSYIGATKPARAAA
jgi:hypothetical protein